MPLVLLGDSFNVPVTIHDSKEESFLGYARGARSCSHARPPRAFEWIANLPGAHPSAVDGDEPHKVARQSKVQHSTIVYPCRLFGLSLTSSVIRSDQKCVRTDTERVKCRGTRLGLLIFPLDEPICRLVNYAVHAFAIQTPTIRSFY
ncbi:hypothetical protein EVAR_49090_1 [Eumeta japonica]|uniref:Uncharacterized protein n=1 Tax=Eumeta variegata TaxID=151549 RepID=A0A4C1Z9L5_EUMVA|nr:hypothetical protein EVAR_49090_1 [Eumeta japonica]